MGLTRDRVIITKKAQASIYKIYKHVRRVSSEEIAKKVRDALISRCRGLKDFSGYSKERYLDGDYRSVTQWDYLIIYTVFASEIRILQVLHTSQHPDKRKKVD